MVPLYVYSAIGAIVIFSIVAIQLKYLIPQVGGPFQFTFIQFIVALSLHLVVLTGWTIVTGNSINTTWNYILQIFLASLFGFSGFVCYMIGLDRGNASVGGVVLSSRVFMSIPLAFLFFGEVYQVSVYFAIIIAFTGAVLVSWQQKLSLYSIITFRSPGMRFFLLTAFFWTMQNFFIRNINNQVPLLVLLTIRMLFFAIFATFIYLLLIGKFNFPKVQVNRSVLFGIIFYVILVLFSQIGLVYALGENLTISETIGTFEGTLTFIFSIIFAKFVNNDVLKEQLQKNTLLLRSAGVILSVVGTLLTILLI